MPEAQIKHSAKTFIEEQKRLEEPEDSVARDRYKYAMAGVQKIFAMINTAKQSGSSRSDDL